MRKEKIMSEEEKTEEVLTLQPRLLAMKKPIKFERIIDGDYTDLFVLEAEYESVGKVKMWLSEKQGEGLKKTLLKRKKRTDSLDKKVFVACKWCEQEKKNYYIWASLGLQGAQWLYNKMLLDEAQFGELTEEEAEFALSAIRKEWREAISSEIEEGVSQAASEKIDVGDFDDDE